jgi:hydrogenase maturation protein HypF
LKIDYQKILLSLGAEMNSKISISKDGYLFSSQYLGDISYYHSLLFLEDTVQKFIKMLDVNNLEKIAIDMHPQYSYHYFADKLAEKYNSKIVKVQHHHAHAATLLYEHNLEKIIAITLDGTGYGMDGKIWGGEILNASYKNFDRIASLEELPLVGGESGIKNPIRLVYGVNELLNEPLNLRYDRELYSKLVKNAIKTTSFGRVLDTLSAYLKVCEEMYYDGEPAMKLETYLYRGSKNFEFETEIEKTENRKIIKVLPLFQQLFELNLKTEKDKSDAAYSFVYALLEKYAEIALDYSDTYDLSIGISGGVSYNFVINTIFESQLKNKDLKLHKQIPNGDNGISIGQNLIAAQS